MTKKLKIVSIAAEVAPFSKTGGLADVAKSLPEALKKLGHEVIIITPLYGQIIDTKKYDLKFRNGWNYVNLHHYTNYKNNYSDN
jgi:starch synthase